MPPASATSTTTASAMRLWPLASLSSSTSAPTPTSIRAMRTMARWICTVASLAPVMEQARLVHLGTVASTQEAARELPIGSVVVADHQTAGRGRLGRRWEAPPGSALLASFVLRPHRLLSLAAGVAAAEACGPDVRLKWPNDLLLRGRKPGGILVEATSDKAICGIGINLTCAPEGAAKL